jgi:lysozyme family protein
MANEDSTGKGIISNDPKDPGGMTKWGISKRSYPDLDIAGLTREQALEIYYRDWWVRYRYGEIDNSELAAELLDIAVTNPSAAHKCLQRAVVNTMGEIISIDGAIGSRTIEAVNNHPNQAWLLDRFKLLAIEHYLGCHNDRFLGSWVRRAID